VDGEGCVFYIRTEIWIEKEKKGGRPVEVNIRRDRVRRDQKSKNRRRKEVDPWRLKDKKLMQTAKKRKRSMKESGYYGEKGG